MKVFLTEQEIQKRVQELGKEITNDYNGKDIIAFGILKGSMIFIADLIRQIKTNVEVEFILASSYGDSTVSSGNVKIVSLYERKISGYHVLLVEDIIDTGLTLNKIVAEILLNKPKSFEICSLFVKKQKHKFEHKIKYIGFEIPDIFLVGYGLDLDGRYRNLPHVALVEEEFI